MFFDYRIINTLYAVLRVFWKIPLDSNGDKSIPSSPNDFFNKGGGVLVTSTIIKESPEVAIELGAGT